MTQDQTGTGTAQPAQPAPTTATVTITFSERVIERATQMAWMEYREAVGGVAFNDDQLPEWQDVKPHLQNAWRRSIIKVLTLKAQF